MASIQEFASSSTTVGAMAPPHARPSILQNALEDAVLAPSTHNTQPWLFRVRGDTVDLLADRTRALHVLDPQDRELVISCGAALFQFRLGLRVQGLDSRVTTPVDLTSPDLLARVTLEGYRDPTEDERTMHAAIRRRHTNEDRFLGMQVPDDVLAAMMRAAELEGARFQPLLDEGERTRLVALVMEGDHQLWGDEWFRRELADWLRTQGDPRHDGVSSDTQGALASRVAPSFVRAFDLGHRHATHDRDLADGSALLGVIASRGDERSELLRAGQALARVLLVATVEGLAASFFNQPVEEPDLRVVLDTLLPKPWHAQAVLRIGYAPPGHGQPRRPVSDVVR